MGKRRICCVSILCMICCLFTASVDISAKGETHLSKKRGKYEAYQLELKNYRMQSAMRKEDMERAYEAYILSGSDVSLQSYKEAELAYKKAAFYNNNGKRWLKEQWQQEDGKFQLQIASYWLLGSECKYIEVQLQSLGSMYRETVQKRKKGIVTRADEKGLRCQLKNLKEQLNRKKKEIREQKKQIRYKSGDKSIRRAAIKHVSSGDGAYAKYLSAWKKNKVGYRQILYEISIYKNYQKGFHKDVPGQYIRIRFAKNEVRLLTIQKEQYLERLKQTIRKKINDFREAKALRNAKDREIAFAREKLKLIRLLHKKGQIVKSKVLEQKEQVAKLAYEKAVYQCSMDTKLIELEYGLESSVNE